VIWTSSWAPSFTEPSSAAPICESRRGRRLRSFAVAR
jgi:hypothetical protein